MIAATAIASIVLFIAAQWLFGVARAGVGVLGVAGRAMAAMGDEALGDEAREKTMQRAAIELLRALVSIVFRSALALLASLLPIWLASSTGWAGTDDVFRFLSRWDVLVVASIVIIAGYFILTRLRLPR